MNNYFSFTQTGDFQGVYSPVIVSNTQPIGTIAQPSDILKFNSGTDAWNQIPYETTYSNIGLTIKSLTSLDWTSDLKLQWLNDYLKHVDLFNFLTDIEKDSIILYFDSIDLFQQLSAPSLAYITKHDGTNGLVLDPYLTNEVSIGLNSYLSNYILDFAYTLPSTNDFRNKIIKNHKKDDVYLSNCCKITYLGFTNIVYSFGYIEYPLYDISNIGLTPSLTNGGGKYFTEVKLAGNHIQSHYIVKKNISDIDPTIGLCSGIRDEKFCMGDNIVIIDTTCYTTYNSINGWTWIGDLDTLIKDTVMCLADITDPVLYYSSTPIAQMLFPIRTITLKKFSDFQ